MRFQGLGGGTDVDRSTFVKYRAIGNLGHGDFAIIIFQPQIIHTAIEGPIIRTGIIDIGVGIFLQIKHWKKIILAGIGKFIVQSNPLKVVIVEAIFIIPIVQSTNGKGFSAGRGIVPIFGSIRFTQLFNKFGFTNPVQLHSDPSE